MKRIFSTLSLLAFLAACGGDGTNPFTNPGTGGDTGGPGGDAAIPESLASDLQSFSYNANNETLTVTGITQDSSPFVVTYTRNAALDSGGYEAYTTQDDGLFRHVTAMVRQSGNSGSVRAGVVATGGQFNRIHHGGYYERNGSYTHRTTGHARYFGTYVGLTNAPTTDGTAPINPGTPAEIIPTRAVQVAGNVTISADFNNSSIEGSIYDRTLVDATAGQPAGASLPSIVLVTGAVAEDGTFFGEEIEYDGQVGKDIGDYGGIFGGPDAESLGGVVNLEEFDDSDFGWDGEVETGVFVLESCESAAGTHPLCSTP